jgi:hypothetical protein
MTTVVKTARTSQAGISPSRFKVPMGDLYKLEDNQGALFVTANTLGKEKAGGFEAKWHTLELRPKFDTLSASAAAVDTTLTVTHGSYFQVNDLIKITGTRESLMVTAVSSNTLTVTRSWGNTAAASAASSSEVLIVSPHYGENATLQGARSVTEVQYTNNVALWRHNLEVSGTLQAIGEQGGTFYGNDVDLLRDQMLLTHKRDINHACLFSELGASGDQRSMMGIIEFIKTYGTNRVNSTSAVTFSVFTTAAKSATRYNNRRMVIICSRQFAQIVSEWALNTTGSHVNVDNGSTMFGLEVMDIRTPHGRFRLLVDDALEGTEYSQYAIMLATEQGKGPKWRYLRDTRIMKNRQQTDQDGYEEEVLTEGTLENGGPDFHYLFDNADTSS